MSHKSAWSWTVGLLMFVLGARLAAGADRPAGRVVWWGQNDFWKTYVARNTNGVLDFGNEFVTNAVAVAGDQWQALLLRADGTVLTYGHGFHDRDNASPGISNVVSIAVTGGYAWGFRRDGTVACWPGSFAPADSANRVVDLTNLTTIAWAGNRNFLGLRADGTLQGISLDAPDAAWQEGLTNRVTVAGGVVSNVVAVAALDTPLVLTRDGKVYCLAGHTVGGEFYGYGSLEPVVMNGQPLTNVVSLASGDGHYLALRRDGTVAAWGLHAYGMDYVPAGLSDVTAIAAANQQSLALKRDGTVVAWGNNAFGQTNVPAGLSNVTAIAATMDFSLAITTGNVPASVFIQPHGRLEEMAAAADLVFKGRVLVTHAVTNAAFPDWAKPYATEFEVISVIKGEAPAGPVRLLHMTGGPMAWSGPAPPESYQFEPGRSYLVFGVRADKPDWMYNPATNPAAPPGEFRQLMRSGSITALRTRDERPLTAQAIKPAAWDEFIRLLADDEPTNQLYAINELDGLSPGGSQPVRWDHSDDYRRAAVLNAVLPCVTNRNEAVACRALSCFAVEPGATAELEPYAATLIYEALNGPTARRRLSAISALSGLDGDAVTNSLAQLLRDPDDSIRMEAVRLLPRFPTAFAEPALRSRAADPAANVRAVVADVIGEQQYVRLLPVLVALFADPVGKDPMIKPLTLEALQAGQRWDNNGDVHTSAGLALVKFPPAEVADILKTNLNDPGFHINFVAKLAQGDPEPWLPELVSILEARCALVDELTKAPWDDPRKLGHPENDRVLVGTYAKCWEDLRQYLLHQSADTLASGALDKYLDLMDKAVRPDPGCPGCHLQEPQLLYQLYWDKQLTNRAANLRGQYDKYDRYWYDEYSKPNHGDVVPDGGMVF